MRHIIVAGSGRSGTTWVGDVLASCRGCYSVFEPLRISHVPGVPSFAGQGDRPGTYLRPNEENPEWGTFFRRLFNRKISNTWTRRDWILAERPSRTILPNRLSFRIARHEYQFKRLLAKCCVTKMIRGNLLLQWIAKRFDVSVVYLTRHPCSAIGSQMRMNWWSDSLEDIFAQKKLMIDYLEPYQELLKGAKTPLQRTAMLWCVENIVPLAHLSTGANWIAVSYEELMSRSPSPFDRLFGKLQLYPSRSTESVIATPVNHASPCCRKQTAWHDPLTEAEGSEVLEICSKFGIGLYGRQSLPLSEPKNSVYAATVRKPAENEASVMNGVPRPCM